MNDYEYLTDDGQAMLLLCSALGLADDDAAVAAPYTLSEWNQLARAIQESPLERPAALLGRSAAELADALKVLPTDAERIVRLLDRGGRVISELENLHARGIWAVTRADAAYPAKLRQTLKHQAPSVLFGAGELRRLNRAGIAVVGSRQIDEAGQAFARRVGEKCAEAGVPVVSGGARGSDSLAMLAAIEAGGVVYGALADSLERAVRQPELRQFLLDDRLVLLTPYLPTAGFSVGAAMGRNKLIYGLADFAVVVSSDFQTGGTWAGAVEALKAAWCPVFVREAAEVPKGNRELIAKGAAPLTEDDLAATGNLPEWLGEHARVQPVQPAEKDLFGMAVREPRASYRAPAQKKTPPPS
jgi:predicted Rossmann fold nucleotide-binding protein DprA/Smf involved in DNA uptake